MQTSNTRHQEIASDAIMALFGCWHDVSETVFEGIVLSQRLQSLIWHGDLKTKEYFLTLLLFFPLFYALINTEIHLYLQRSI